MVVKCIPALAKAGFVLCDCPTPPRRKKKPKPPPVTRSGSPPEPAVVTYVSVKEICVFPQGEPLPPSRMPTCWPWRGLRKIFLKEIPVLHIAENDGVGTGPNTK